MKPIQLGIVTANPSQLDLATGSPLHLDLMTLVDTRLLVQANSGGGKSGTLRLIAERASATMQTIILDSEGEFATLREKVDMLLVGDGGELPADPRSAKLLARRLLETRVSAVIDLYDLELDTRREFVKIFLSALIALPRDLWRPTLIILDEAHLYAPESGDKATGVATKAVIGLMSQGRKRGYCGILATQRFSKLHKDASAEINNVLIGRTWQDVDQERAGKILGIRGPDRSGLKDLHAREFFGFGPAFSVDGVFKMRTADVATTMPKAGHRGDITVPPASANVRALLAAELANLPEEAQAEGEEIETLRRENGRLKREMAARPVQVDEGALDHARQAGREAQQGLVAREAELVGVRAENTYLRSKIGDALASLQLAKVRRAEPVTERPEAKVIAFRETPPTRTRPPAVHPNGNVSGPQQRILNSLAWLEALRLPTPKKNVVAWLSDASSISSAYANNLGALRSLGMIDYPSPGLVGLTEAGRRIAQAPDTPLTAVEMQRAVYAKVTGPQRSILESLIRRYPKSTSREIVAEEAGASSISSAYANNLGALRSLGLIDYPERGHVVAEPLLFLKAGR